MSNYLGINSIARRVSGYYWGAKNKAQKVRRIYVGINGVAQLAMTDGTTASWKRYNVVPAEGYKWAKYKAVCTHEDHAVNSGNINDTWTVSSTAKLFDVFSVNPTIANGLFVQDYTGINSSAVTGAWICMSSIAHNKIYYCSNVTISGSTATLTLTSYKEVVDNSTYEPGDFVEFVYEKTDGAHTNGTKNADGFWYTFIEYIPAKLGAYIDTITSDCLTLYPIDGIVGDYWYQIITA